MVKKITLNEAKEKSKGLKYFIVFYFDSLKYGEISDNEFDFENINEIFLFNKDETIHGYIENGLEFVYINTKDEEDIIYEEQLLDSDIYKKIKIKKVLEKDEDFQYYIGQYLPCELIK